MSASLPHRDVLGAVAEHEPVTVSGVVTALGCPWSQRGTIRNRIEDLVADGELIADEGRPERFAINHLRTGGDS